MNRLVTAVSLLVVAVSLHARAADGDCKLLYNPIPKYPLLVRRAYVPVSGSGTFSVTFDSSGKVTAVKALKSTNYYSLDEAAISTLRTWKSRPGRPCSILVPIKFHPESPAGF